MFIALMLGLGVVSRLASGAVADQIGAGPMLILGSSMQAAALLLYLYFNSKSSLYVISGLFGLFPGGVVPMYAVIIRKYLPPREAGIRISLVLMPASAWPSEVLPPDIFSTPPVPTAWPSCMACSGIASISLW